MARKYSKYEIKVTYTNGDIENIKLSGIDNGSYTAMLDMYKQIKERYKDTECNIDFVGVSDNGEMGILFTKEIKNNNKPWFVEEAEQYTEQSMFNLVQQLHDTINLIERRGNWMTGELDLLNKMQDIYLHRIECYSNELGEEEKNSYLKT